MTRNDILPGLLSGRHDFRPVNLYVHDQYDSRRQSQSQPPKPERRRPPFAGSEFPVNIPPQAFRIHRGRVIVQSLFCIFFKIVLTIPFF